MPAPAAPPVRPRLRRSLPHDWRPLTGAERAWLAHTTASLAAFAVHKPKAMPTLDSLTGSRPALRVQTPDEMKAAFAAWRRQGGEG